MAFTGPDFHMPGAYNFDGPAVSGGPALSAGMFRPPVSPSASSSVYNLARSTGSLYSDVSMANNTPVALNGKRKRTRESTPLAQDWNLNMDGASELVDDNNGAGGRQPRYVLAGQIETPGAATGGVENGALEDSVYSDVGYRRALGSDLRRDDVESPSVRLSHFHLADSPAAAPSSAGWSMLALNTIGGVVGRVWEFCTAGGFKGFYAGGGKGYDLSGESPAGNTQRSPNGVDGSPNVDGRRLPGSFPQSDYITYRPSGRETPDTATRPAAKRRQISEANDELRKNWVIVDEPSPIPTGKRMSAGSAARTSGARPPLTRSHQSRHSTASSSSARRINVPISRLSTGAPPLTRRVSARISHAGSPSLTSREPASFAQPRSPASLAPPITSSRVPVASQPNPFATLNARTASPRPSSRQSRIPSPSPATHTNHHLGHSRNHSSASAASTSAPRRPATLDADDIEASPRLNAEAKHLAQKKIAAERDADARINAFNARLKEMIRQGKEALGSTVEVDYEGGGGGGWEDDDEDADADDAD